MELHLFTYTPEKTKCITYTGHSHISLDVLNIFPVSIQLRICRVLTPLICLNCIMFSFSVIFSCFKGLTSNTIHKIHFEFHKLVYLKLKINIKQEKQPSDKSLWIYHNMTLYNAFSIIIMTSVGSVLFQLIYNAPASIMKPLQHFFALYI